MAPAPRPTVEQLVDDGVELLSDYLAAPRTDLLRQLASVVVDLRSRFSLDDGRPDWGGRSPDYRSYIADLYTRAGVPKDKLDTIQAAMRYHVGNLIRERAPKDELLAVGLTTTAPRDRNAATRDALHAISAAAGGRTPSSDVDRLAVYAQALLDFIDDVAVRRLEAERAAVSRMALERVQTRSAELLAALSTSPDPGQRGKGPRGLSAV